MNKTNFIYRYLRNSMNFLKNTKKNIQIKLLKFASVGSNLNIVGFPIYVFNPNVKIGNSVVIYPNVTFLVKERY